MGWNIPILVVNKVVDMKTNAEIILRKWLNKHFSISKGLYLPIEPKLDKLYDLSKMAGIDGYKRGREDERKKVMPKITREQVEELAYCLHELRRSWNGNSHGKIKWDNSVKDRYEILAKECIEAMGLEVEVR